MGAWRGGYRRCERSAGDGAVSDGDGPRVLPMLGLVAVLVATVILVFFAIGYLLGRLLL